MKTARITAAILLLLSCTALGQRNESIKVLETSSLAPMDVHEFNVWRWGFDIEDPALNRVDLRFYLGTNEFVHTWLFVENTNRVQRLEIAIDFLKDTDANQWRLYARFRDQSSCWTRTLPVPQEIKRMGRHRGCCPIPIDDRPYLLATLFDKPEFPEKEIPVTVTLDLTGK